MNELDFSNESLEYIEKNLNNENKIYIKALILYYFIRNKNLSYEQVAKLLDIDEMKLLDIYDDLKVSTSEITLPYIEDLLINNNLVSKAVINKFNEEEGLLKC